MIGSGLYQHYKGKLYRVLFVAAWNTRDMPSDDELLRVWLPRANTAPCVALAPAQLEAGSYALFSARWSGNSTSVYIGEPVVIYVALYDNGRIAARSLHEFEEYVDVPCSDVRGATHNVPRFERIAD